MNQWIVALFVLGFAVGILWVVYFIVRYAVLGKDTWPYSKNGPFNSTEQDIWEAEARLEHERKVPRP